MKHFLTSNFIQKVQVVLLGLFLSISVSVPLLAYAQSNDMTGGGKWFGITYDCGVQSDGKTQVYKTDKGQKLYGNCNYNDLIAAIKKTINVATMFALAFTVVILAYAGFKYLTSQGNPGKIGEANKMFWKVAEGIVYMLAAWLIVHFILVALTTVAVQQATPIQ